MPAPQDQTIELTPSLATSTTLPRLRVLFFYQDFGAQGGIERYLHQTALALRETGRFDPIMVCCENTPLYRQLKQEELTKGLTKSLTVYGVPNRPFFARSIARTFDIATWLHLWRIVQREKPDIAHVHIGLIENCLFRLLKIPVVYTFHGYGTLYSMTSASNAGILASLKKCFKHVTRFLFQQTLKGVDTLLFVSHAEQQRMHMEGYLPTSSPDTSTRCLIDTLPNGVPVEALQERARATDQHALRQRLNIPTNARCIGFINRLDANKNPLHFLELAHALSNDPDFGPDLHDQNLHFLVVGDGPLSFMVKTAVEAEAHASGLKNVHILGHRDDIPELLSILDVVVYPARREGFGLGLVEAMAVGVPCVAYASEGASEILAAEISERAIPDTTIRQQEVSVDLAASCLVPVDDVAALQRATKALLQQSPREKRALQAALQTRAHAYDYPFFLAQLETFYRHLCPLVSIILPVYQGEKTILNTVRSVLAQHYPHWELLVVDDGSTDGTLALLETMDDPRIRIFPEQNQGVALARNFGFRQAKGDYIAFIDADDCWLPQKLTSEIATIRQHTTPQNPACMVYSAYYAVDEQGRLTHCPPIRTQHGDLSAHVLEDEGVFLPSTAMVHRRVFETVGGFRHDCYHEDRVFFIEACQQFPAFSTKQRLVLYQQSLSGRCRRILANYDEAIEAELSIVNTLKDTLPPDTLDHLAQLQARNLLYRFLMYGYQTQARQLYRAFEIGQISLANPLMASYQPTQTPSSSQTAQSWDGLLKGKKGLLARWTLQSGINFLMFLRLFIQGIYRHAVSPIWSHRIAASQSKTQRQAHTKQVNSQSRPSHG